ncbi:MAG: glycogen debranching protein, partial [Caldilineaceae bacterium]|nr:glycogen debranching protein [Caldilineaceae bacterium]
MLQVKLLQEAHSKATNVLHECATPYGFRASAMAAGYPQIWARDSVITFLGAAATGDQGLMRAGRASLETLGKYQSSRGLIPLNVNPDSGYVSTENAGAADANLWFILGHYLYYHYSEDLAFLQEQWPLIDKAMLWLDYQDMNECGLIEVPEAGDWMDLIAVRYNVLYDNVLYYAAKVAHQELAVRLPAGTTVYRADVDAAGVHERLNLLMWIDRCWVAEHFAEHLERLKLIRLEWFMLYHNVGTISSRPF